MIYVADLLSDLATYLQARRVISGDGVDTFRDFTPDSPSSCVTLFEYPGTPDFMSEAAARSVQVMVRDGNAESARQKAWAIYNVLNVPDDRIIYFTSTRWTITVPRQTPTKIGIDEHNKVLWGFNLAITTNGD